MVRKNGHVHRGQANDPQNAIDQEIDTILKQVRKLAFIPKSNLDEQSQQIFDALKRRGDEHYTTRELQAIFNRSGNWIRDRLVRSSLMEFASSTQFADSAGRKCRTFTYKIHVEN